MCSTLYVTCVFICDNVTFNFWFLNFSWGQIERGPETHDEDEDLLTESSVLQEAVQCCLSFSV